MPVGGDTDKCVGLAWGGGTIVPAMGGGVELAVNVSRGGAETGCRHDGAGRG